MKNKDHAKFQSNYNQSKNFPSETKEETFKTTGDGTIKLDEQEPLSNEQKNEIADAMDTMRERMEITPGESGSEEKNEK